MSWTGYIVLSAFALSLAWRLWVRVTRGPVSVRAASMVARHEHPGSTILSWKRGRERYREVVRLDVLTDEGRAVVLDFEIDKSSLRVRPITDPTVLPADWPAPASSLGDR
jgi:hypothetical protein